MSSTQEILNIILAIGFLIITVCTVYMTYYFVKAMKSITTLSDSLEETTQGLKDKLQMKALAAIPALLVALAGKVMKKGRG